LRQKGVLFDILTTFSFFLDEFFCNPKLSLAFFFTTKKTEQTVTKQHTDTNNNTRERERELN